MLYIYKIWMAFLKGRGTSIKSTIIQFFHFSARYALYTMVNIKKGKIHSCISNPWEPKPQTSAELA